MLTLNIETSLQLKDDASLNAADGIVATVFDDPNKLEITDMTEWFSARVNTLGTFKSVIWTPHFVSKFMMLEMDQTVDLEILLPASVRQVVPQYGVGTVAVAQPDVLTHNLPIFANVIPGDTLVVISGDHAVPGDAEILDVIDDYNIRLVTPIYTGSTTVNDFVFKVTRIMPMEAIIMRDVNKLCELFMPIESIKITNVSIQNVAIRSLFLG